MSQQLIYLLIGLGVVVCIVAVVYIYRHYTVIKTAKTSQILQAEQSQERYQKNRAYLIESIQVIARAVGNDEKLTYTEACMRLTALIEALAPHLLQHADFSVIFEVYKRTEHIPIKEGWKKLSKQQRWKYQQEMALCDKEYGEKIKSAAAILAEYDFDHMLH
ncbi:DUF2489 domain-containing protein [uncultured Neptuniibacter sp.]|uniref:DUF2489 domain-containing protein n=1 Tax=uncultured Neptuniibacter sp. TaxID=502143 RepID=UPI002611D0D4|nr:DUF2489 domain-containing protein [uncultured Neptuniibacter sp.]